MFRHLPSGPRMFHVYLLRCSDSSFYVGSCSDLSTRLAAHHRGEAATWTAARRPVELVHSEAFPSREEAVLRERQIKGWTHAKKAALAVGDIARLRSLARSGSSQRASEISNQP